MHQMGIFQAYPVLIFDLVGVSIKLRHKLSVGDRGYIRGFEILLIPFLLGGVTSSSTDVSFITLS
jgi:hypothetical protein